MLFNGVEHKDAIWWYKYPMAECIAITGLVCFYTEKPGVEIWVDGVKQEKQKK